MRLLSVALLTSLLVAMPSSAERLKKGVGGGSVGIFATAITSADWVDGTYRLERAKTGITLVRLSCVATGTTVPSLQIVRVVECTTDAASCAASGMAVSVSARETNTADITATDGSIDAGQWWGFWMVSATTEADVLHCTVQYTR